MLSVLTTILSFLVVIAILITVHEYGHFWVARRSGVKVERFSIGFGKPLWRWRGKQDGTEYVIAAIPLGGYVKMLDEREGEVPEEERHRAFNRQSLKVRSAIVAAGPAANFLLAIAVFWLVLVTGDAGIRPVIAEVIPGSLAEQAGFQPGDQPLRVGAREVATWEQLVHALLAHSGEGRVAVEVRDQRGLLVQRMLPEHDLLALLEEQELFAALGIERGPRIPALIGEVVAGEAADQAGVLAGDRVVAVDRQEIASWHAFTHHLRQRPGESLLLGVEREGRLLELPVRLGEVVVDGERVGRIGAAVTVPEGFFDPYRVVVRQGPLEAVGNAVVRTWDLSGLMLKMVWRMLTGTASVEKNLGSVISIAQAAGQSVEYGVAPFLKFLAQISIVLAIMNLLPIPLLDGGHLLFFLIEAIRGKPLAEETQERAQQVGLVLLLTLIGFALYLDVLRLLG